MCLKYIYICTKKHEIVTNISICLRIEGIGLYQYNNVVKKFIYSLIYKYLFEFINKPNNEEKNMLKAKKNINFIVFPS